MIPKTEVEDVFVVITNDEFTADDRLAAKGGIHSVSPTRAPDSGCVQGAPVGFGADGARADGLSGHCSEREGNLSQFNRKVPYENAEEQAHWLVATIARPY